MHQSNSSIKLIQSSRVSPEEAAELARRLIAVNDDYNTISKESHLSNFVRKGLLNELLERVEAVLKADIPHPSALNLAGRIAFDLDLSKLAKDYFQRAATLEPNNAELHLNHGNALSACEQYEPAIAAFKTALEIDNGNISAFFGIAHCLMETGRYDKAFLHYRSALSLGFSNHLLRYQIGECIQNLQCDAYNEHTEAVLLYLLKSDDTDTRKLIPFATQLFTHKYHLEDEHCVLDINLLATDELLLHILETGVVANVHFEELVTQLRLSILTEASISGSLRDDLVPCAVAIGVYASHSDFALVLSDQEEAFLAILKQQIVEEIGYQKVVIDDLAGALILLAMYEALYVQNFSFDLLAYDLEDWPVGMQNVMEASLYALSKEHQARYELFGQTMTELLDNGVTRARDRWKAFPAPNQSNFYLALKKQLSPEQPPKSWRSKTIRILMLSCGSGEKAYRYATQFHNVQVVGAEQNQVELAYAHAQTRDLNLRNLEFALADYALPPADSDKFDYIEFGEDFNYAHVSDWLGLLAEDGIARFHLPSSKRYEETAVLNELIRSRRMQPSLENIRVLRNSIMLEKSSSLWDKILSNPSFYSGAGCRDLIFDRGVCFFDADRSYGLLKTTGLSMIQPLKAEALTDDMADTIDLFAAKEAY